MEAQLVIESSPSGSGAETGEARSPKAGQYGQEKMLRGQRTRGPKMAKIQNSKNPIRSAQNVGQVPISMGDVFKNQKRVILDQNSRDIKNPKKWDPGPSLLSPLGGLLVH